MFGWEFPPHIAGGLGTASYGLTKGADADAADAATGATIKVELTDSVSAK